MKKHVLQMIVGAGLVSLFVLGSGCSKVSIYVDGQGGETSNPSKGTQTLITFHATVEGRNLTRSISPIAKDVEVRLFAFDGFEFDASGTPIATGIYESTVPGLLTGLSGYKMFLTDGIYDFYGVSENLPYTPIRFQSGKSAPLINGIDYLWWSAKLMDVTSTQISVPIVFLHVATQVVFEVTAGDGITLDQLVMAHISAPEDGAQMDLETGVIPPTTTYDAGPNDKMGINGQLAQYIMLPLQTSVPLEVSFDVLVNGESTARTYSVTVPVPDGELAAGNSYRFEAVIEANTVSFSSVGVRSWVDVDETGKPLYPQE